MVEKLEERQGTAEEVSIAETVQGQASSPCHESFQFLTIPGHLGLHSVHRRVDGQRRTMRSSYLQNIQPARISTDSRDLGSNHKFEGNAFGSGSKMP